MLKVSGEKKYLKHDKHLTECGNRDCESCQCHKHMKVICKGHCFKTGHIPRSGFKLLKKDRDRKKKEEKKKPIIKSKYTIKFLRSLLSQRTWVIAPDFKLNCQTMDLRRTKLIKVPENLYHVDGVIEAVRLDESHQFHDVSFFKELKHLRVAVMKHCNLQDLSETGAEGSDLIALDIYGNQYIDSFTDLKLFLRLQHLNLGRCNLICVPEEVLWLKKLRVLILDDNCFQQPLTDLSSLTKLQVLLLQNCGLTEFPKDVAKMEELVYLSIECNHIPIVPFSLTQLENLMVLSVYGNKKIQLSNKLTRCPQLKRINVDHTFSSKSLSSKMMKLVKEWKDTPSAWWKQLV